MRKISTFLFLFSCLLTSCEDNEEKTSTPFYEGTGNFHKKIDTESKDAQRYFDQGMIFLYGYNYPEATRSFRAAAESDPSSGICLWGETVSLADCIDDPGDKWCVQAYRAMKESNNLENQASPKEKDIIDTVSDRYEKQGSNYQIFDRRFVDRMSSLHQKYPNDPDIAAIFANSYMHLTDLSEGMVDGKPTGATKEIVDTLEDALKKHPYHPGLNHFYIHAMEGCGTPRKALAAAERLDGSVPISGHLQHMPGHIYYDVGRYHEASGANQRGIDADIFLFTQGGLKVPEFAGFYLHNHYYLFRSLTMEGRSKDALKASDKVIDRIDSGDLPSNPYLKNVFYSIPYLLLARFGKWDKLDEKAPPKQQYPFTRGIWHYASGLSALHRNNLVLGDQHLQHLKELKKQYDRHPNDPAYSEYLSNLLEMGYLDLDGQIAQLQGKPQIQINNLKKALQIEQTMYLGMLPWYMPMRHALGKAYLDAGMPHEAQMVYTKDLEENPNNGWALEGLIQSMHAQKIHKGLFKKNSQLQDTWKYADIQLTGSRF